MIDMGDRLRRALSDAPVLLFGPLALSFDDAAFTQLRKIVVENEGRSRWILETIAELPQYYKTITGALPSLKTESGLQQLEALKCAFLTEQPLEIPFPLPNVLLMPLVVISHLTQYVSFLERTEIELDDCVDLFAAPKRIRETLGLCTGLISALAVSSSDSKEKFSKYGSVAVRLSMLLGMVVDARNTAPGLEMFKSLSTAWAQVENGEEMLRILNDFPEVWKYPFTPGPLSPS